MNPSTFIYPDITSPAHDDLIGQPGAFIRTPFGRVHWVSGVPSAVLGADGDFALRFDGAAGANTTLYHKETGNWVACTL